MRERIEKIIFYDELSPEEQEAFQEELSDDSEAAADWRRWQEVRAALRRSLNERLPDRNLLVLYALQRSGREHLLSGDERRRLEEARGTLEQAVEEHPGLADVVWDVQQDCDTFEALWEEQAGLGQNGRTARGNGVDRPPAHEDSRRRSTFGRWAWRLSAAVIVGLFALLAVLLLQRDYSMISVVAEEGEVRRVELADGSVVRLFGGSKLTYPDPEEDPVLARQAQLVGRAFFDIAPDEEGFSIETPTATATVLGTSFGLEATEEMTELVLATGRVALAPRQAQEKVVVLKPGQRSRVGRNALPSTPASVDLTDALEWTGLFFFRGTPLTEIAERLTAHYEEAVVVAPPLQDEKVTGTFQQSQSLQEVLNVVTAALGASVRVDEQGRYVIAPSP